MDSLNSLLIGFYTLLSYSYSQRHTHTLRCEMSVIEILRSLGAEHRSEPGTTSLETSFGRVASLVIGLPTRRETSLGRVASLAIGLATRRDPPDFEEETAVSEKPVEARSSADSSSSD